jgi:hypothetical protein
MEANRTGILEERSSGRNRGWRRRLRRRKKGCHQRRAGKGWKTLITPSRFCSVEAAKVLVSLAENNRHSGMVR